MSTQELPSIYSCDYNKKQAEGEANNDLIWIILVWLTKTCFIINSLDSFLQCVNNIGAPHAFFGTNLCDPRGFISLIVLIFFGRVSTS